LVGELGDEGNLPTEQGRQFLPILTMNGPGLVAEQ
jgi:hypothetical protein